MLATVYSFHVFACTGKRPRVRWSKEATTDPDAISAYWDDNPGYDIGVATGPSHLVVLDFDGEKGLASKSALEKEGPLPDTMTSLTARGMHLYFAARPADQEVRSSAGVLAPGVDVRARGGMVIAPRSCHSSGQRYAWLTLTQPTILPGWLHEMLTRPKPARRITAAGPPTTASLAYVLGAIRAESDRVRSALPGSRNATLNRSAWSIGRFVDTGMMNVADLARPLLEAAIAAGLTPEEAERTITSAFRARRTEG